MFSANTRKRGANRASFSVFRDALKGFKGCRKFRLAATGPIDSAPRQTEAQSD